MGTDWVFDVEWDYSLRGVITFKDGIWKLD
jgi:hypothetical protein